MQTFQLAGAVYADFDVRAADKAAAEVALAKVRELSEGESVSVEELRSLGIALKFVAFWPEIERKTGCALGLGDAHAEE